MDLISEFTFRSFIAVDIQLDLSVDDLKRHLRNFPAPVCWSCFKLCREAFSTFHPCTLCAECRQQCLQGLQDAHLILCPAERTCHNKTLETADLQTINHFYRDLFDDLQFLCPNKEQGCEERLPFDDLEWHVQNTCPFDVRACKFCGEKTLKVLLPEHENKDCELRLVDCELCDKPVRFIDKDTTHKDLTQEDCCFELRGDCPYCKEVKVTRMDLLSEHLPVCKASPRHCCFADIGCPFFETEVRVLKHEANFQSEHLNLMKKSLQDLRSENEALKTEFGLSSVPKQDVLDAAIAESHLTEFSVKQASLQQSVVNNGEAFEGLKIEVMQLKKRLDQKEHDQKVLEVALRKATSAEEKILDTLKFQGFLLDIALADTRGLWILDGVEGNRKSQPHQVSPAFYTGNPGYKYVLEVCLDGAGIGKESHLSLFLRIVRGEHDNRLAWPCPLTFTLEVLKLSDGQRRFTPATREVSWKSLLPKWRHCFEKPKFDKNERCGAAEILPLQETFTADFVKEDKMVIKASISHV